LRKSTCASSVRERLAARRKSLHSRRFLWTNRRHARGLRAMMSTNLALSRMHFPIMSLGYGRRIALWTQGCSLGCKGCMSVDTWATRPANTPIDEVITRLDSWLSEADGLTVSGGEPFDQPKAIIALLTAVRARVRGDILLFTGYR